MLYDYLNKWNPEVMSMEENISTLAGVKPLVDIYTNLSIPMPTWIETKISNLEITIKKQYRAKIEADLVRATARRAALKTKEEAREDADKEIERIKSTLSTLDE